jgi:biopolymer transport protein ExbB
LGTVTGIINTFKLISAFGSGDAKTLSGGISEALVTTEFGLIVAIPSLLLHAFLNRKAKSHIDRMESIAVAVMNQVTKSQNEEYEETNEIEASTINHEKEIVHG